MHASIAALLTFAGLAAATAHDISLTVKVGPGSELEGYQLVAAPEYPEFVAPDQIGDNRVDWYLARAQIGIYATDYYDYILIGVNGTDHELTLGGNGTSPGPIVYTPWYGAVTYNLLNAWTAGDAYEGYPFTYSSYLDGYGHPEAVACSNSDGRFQLSVYPPGPLPDNCVNTSLVWSPFSTT
ncbi:hypothetical protein F4777DRAFT_533660 [Nemania sp. FL0916]|nr:hypothetical protein F4777DRAFT_533660 [Nemania sp. FL0916]